MNTTLRAFWRLSFQTTALLLAAFLSESLAFQSAPLLPEGIVFGTTPIASAMPSEAPEGDFEREVHRIDAVLASALGGAEQPCNMRQISVNWGSLQPPDSRESWHSVEVECTEGARLLSRFKALLRERGSEATVTTIAPDTWEVRVLGRLTHQLHLVLPGQAATQKSTPGQARLVLVIDDLGENFAVARELARFDFPVTYAILPRARYSRKTLELAKAAGREAILHQPMVPIRYPDIDPGPGALFPEQSDERVAQLLEENLDSLPGVTGMNNHMGSRFTQDARGMNTVLGILRRRNLFFLDSVTHPGTQGPQIAKMLGLVFFERDVFLDIEHDARYVVMQLRKAESIAMRKGQAVAIGHPLPATMEGLRRWSRNRNSAVAIVTLGDLLSARAPADPVEPSRDLPPAAPLPPTWLVMPGTADPHTSPAAPSSHVPADQGASPPAEPPEHRGSVGP